MGTAAGSGRVGQIVFGLAGFLVAGDLQCAVIAALAQLAVGAGTDAQIVTELPVVEIVAAGLAGLGKGGDFITLKARPAQ